MKRKAIIIGATGLVGSQLVNQLSLVYDDLTIIARTPPKLMCSSMHFYQLGDFNHLDDVIKNITLGSDTDAFTCLGTTKKQAGSEDAFKRVDYDYNYKFAKLCHDKGVQQFFLLSALSADSNSRFFYSQVKGDLEKAIIELGFRQLVIFRPSMLLGHHKGRPLETLAQNAYKLVSPIIPKSLASRPISAKRVAASITMTAQNLYERNKFVETENDNVNITMIDNKQMLSMTRFTV